MTKAITDIQHAPIGHYNGTPVHEFRLTNAAGNYVELLNYGAIVKSIVVPDVTGQKANVILSYPELDGYLTDASYIGATVGPFANRIANAAFTIGGKAYYLDKNDGANNNHSGSAGFNSKVFGFEVRDGAVIFTLDSPDGEGGFPGNRKTKVIYRFTDANQLIIEYFVTTDASTLVNLTNHAYFNLFGSGTVHNHYLSIAADTMLESTADYIPTGKIIPAGRQTFFGQSLGDVMQGGGINNYYIFDEAIAPDAPVCVLFDEASGRVMQVHTTYPGVQLYTGDFLSAPHQPFNGLCLECQLYPDSPNQPHFPDTILQPDYNYSQSIIYTFGIRS